MAHAQAAPAGAPPPQDVVVDERVASSGPLRRLLVRPEIGAIAGAVVVWAVFALLSERGFLSQLGTASYLQVAAELGILAVAVALLMIAGEFDLSIGSMIGACGIITALLATEYGWNIWLAMAASLAFAVLIGAANGYLVLKTGLPSFIVTLATLFIVRGLSIAITREVTGRTQVSGLKNAPGFDLAFDVFSQKIALGNASYAVSVLWWLALAALATWVLLRTRFGNWIFAVGGNVQAARNVGVPVGLVKISLFIGTAVSAWLLATIQILASGSADVLRGEQREFFAIIAVVIGGTLLTGGYGSAIGAVFGALIYGMVTQGTVYAGIDADWNYVVLGAMLMIAVLVNRVIRQRATEARR